MAEQFAVVDAHVVGDVAGRLHSADDAIALARTLVEKDRKPRVVVRLVSEARISPTPKVDVIEFEGRSHG